MSRHRYCKNFTKAQLRQYKQLENQLQRACAAAAQSLLTLRRLRPGQKRSEHVYADLANLVRRMNFLIACCETIATYGSQTQVSSINMVFGTTCEHCEEMGRTANRSGGRGDIGTLEADPAWGVLIENLLLQTTLAIHRTIDERSSLSDFEELPGCLQNLTTALLRQQRHLARMGGARVPKIVVTYDDAEVCSECGNPYSSGPFVDDEDASSPGITVNKLT